ncbi:MAG: MarR family transcriptional regulator [Sphingomonas sp.]|nr:MarR family transcriptional regulator [Sphingomonas sp.]
MDAFLPYRLSIASNRVSAAVATAYEALFGLSIPQWRLIAVIAQGAGVTQQALGAATQMDKVMVSRAAIALVERGLVKRAPHPDDQRSHLLSLSAAGQALYDAVAPKALALEAQIFGGFSAEESAQFAAMLARVEAAAATIESERG